MSQSEIFSDSIQLLYAHDSAEEHAFGIVAGFLLVIQQTNVLSHDLAQPVPHCGSISGLAQIMQAHSSGGSHRRALLSYAPSKAELPVLTLWIYVLTGDTDQHITVVRPIVRIIAKQRLHEILSDKLVPMLVNIKSAGLDGRKNFSLNTKFFTIMAGQVSDLCGGGIAN